MPQRKFSWDDAVLTAIVGKHTSFLVLYVRSGPDSGRTGAQRLRRTLTREAEDCGTTNADYQTRR